MKMNMDELLGDESSMEAKMAALRKFEKDNHMDNMWPIFTELRNRLSSDIMDNLISPPEGIESMPIEEIPSSILMDTILAHSMIAVTMIAKSEFKTMFYTMVSCALYYSLLTIRHPEIEFDGPNGMLQIQGLLAGFYDNPSE